MQKKENPVKLPASSTENTIGEFLIRFYRKRTASFLANIYKAGITGASKDIHRARLDVKKILAIIDVMRIVRSKQEDDPEYEKIFRKLYKSSGSIREIQVNLWLLGRKEFDSYYLIPFKNDLLQKENVITSDFLKVIRKFDEKKIVRVEKRIKKEIYQITTAVLQKKTGKYIQAKTLLCGELLDRVEGEKDIHELRKHIKELSTVLTLILAIKPDEGLERVISGLNKPEMMIGNWHDERVLADSMKRFLEKGKGYDEGEMAQIWECHHFISEITSKQTAGIIEEVRKALTETTPEVGGQRTEDRGQM